MKKMIPFFSLLLLPFLFLGCEETSLETSSITPDSITTEKAISPADEKETNILSLEEAQEKAQDFITNYLMNGTKAPISDFQDAGSLYTMKVNVNGQTIESYMSKDGETFFPQAMNIEETITQREEAAEQERIAKENELKELEKRETPHVELFVMSHCPFGTQMQKGMLPVVNLLGDQIDFDVKFNDYAMHAMKEVEEQLNQHCIMQEEPEKYLGYLECFLEGDDGPGCLEKLTIDQDLLESCLTSTEEEYGVLSAYEDKTTWKGQFPSFNIYKADNEKYGVQGSPTLVINGKVMKTARDPQTLLDTVCAGFENAPAECEESLSTQTPSSGFGFGVSANTADPAACGS